jgi:hypothetical protein
MGTAFSDIVPVQTAPGETVITLTDSGTPTINGTNLQNEITAAAGRSGPTRIVLPAGVQFVRAGFTLTNKTLDNAFTTIESSQMASIPPAGSRVSPSYASNMPKLLTTGSNVPVISTQTSAHHYRLRGLEISSTTNATFTTFVSLGNDAHTTVAAVPHHLDMDRCYIHAFDTSQTLRRGIALHSDRTNVTGCYISDCKENGSDSQAMGGYNGIGHFFLINNYLEAAGENFLYGGGTNRLPDTATDFVFKRNYCFKPTNWKGTSWDIKNLFEFKFGKRIDVQGNVFKNNWGNIDHDTAIEFKVDSNNLSGNTDAKTVTEDALFAYNKVSTSSAGLLIQGRDWSANRPVRLSRITVSNNNWDDITTAHGAVTGDKGMWAGVHNGSYDVLLEHNTAFQQRFGMAFEDSATWQHSNFRFRNNVMAGSSIGGTEPVRVIRSTQGYESGPLIYNCSDDGFANNNILKGTSLSLFTIAQHLPETVVSTWTGVLVGPPAAGSYVGTDYHIVPGSVYAGSGSDGKDPGADIDAVNAATAGAVAGIWAAPEIILYPAEAGFKQDWTVTNDTSAAGGSYIGQTHSSDPKITTASATPAAYFEMTFNAQAGVPYHIWVRGRSLNNDFNNDSAYLQFDQSVVSAAPGAASKWRIGTSDATVLFLEEGSGAGMHDWGWNDNAYGTVSTDYVYFSTSGKQKLRVQQREDGFQIDQVILSPATYLHNGPALASPGTTKDDTMILSKQQ